MISYKDLYGALIEHNYVVNSVEELQDQALIKGINLIRYKSDINPDEGIYLEHFAAFKHRIASCLSWYPLVTPKGLSPKEKRLYVYRSAVTPVHRDCHNFILDHVGFIRLNYMDLCEPRYTDGFRILNLVVGLDLPE